MVVAVEEALCRPVLLVRILKLPPTTELVVDQVQQVQSVPEVPGLMAVPVLLVVVLKGVEPEVEVD
jgi:hypothetical protein